ncbi:cytoplasmic protein [Priestia flexa]|uniref:cytoplasmic protein n=1 Tax=Priestia flexa TaxID=86664 RepID=UPI003D2EE653
MDNKQTESNKLNEAHFYSSFNRTSLERDYICGCFYCLKIFNPKEIEEWEGKKEDTALCPYCGIDSIIGQSSKFPITKDFLEEMNQKWFG